MPTEAKRATVARAGRGVLGEPRRDRVRLPRPHRRRAGRDPPRAPRQGHQLHGRQEPAGAASPPSRRAARELVAACSRAPRAIALGGSDEAALAKGDPRRPPPVPRPSWSAAARSAARPSTRTAVTRLATLPSARGAARPAGRRHRVAAEHHGRPARRAAAQPGLRADAAARPARGRLTLDDPDVPAADRAPDPNRKETRPWQPDPGPDPRGHRRHDRARAVRVHQEVRGALRRHRRRSRRRCRRCPGRRRLPPRPRPSRSRPSSARCSPRSAPTRSRSSRSCAS